MDDRDRTARYYARRAASYEQVYAKPERQADLALLKAAVRAALQGQRVFELACGTGYWTEQIAAVAESVFATDINPEVIAVAKDKQLPPGKVKFAIADAFDLPPVGTYSACFAGFWWSHVKYGEQQAFLQALRDKLGRGNMLVLIDNIYVEGSSTPIARVDADGNTYQQRSLPNGERYEVVKNFPSESMLKKHTKAVLEEISVRRFQYYWMLAGRFK